MQIQKGALLVPAPGKTPPWAYAGAAVKFDPSGVYAVPANPGLPPGYAAGSMQAFANDNFNYTYTNLLQSLHALFNGDVSAAQAAHGVEPGSTLYEQDTSARAMTVSLLAAR